MRASEIRYFVLIAVLFFAVDCMSLHTGDDLGYLFADSAHHAGDGERVVSLAQCFTTQASHYMTTNGRYLVHVVVMAMLNLVPRWVYRAVNALMFATLWALMVRLVGTTRRNRPAVGALTFAGLLVCIPQPAVVLFTLVSYAVNYLWVAVAYAALLLAIRNKWKMQNGECRMNGKGSAWLLVATFLVGTLQESFAIPACAAFVTASMLRRLPWRVTLMLIAGTAICAFAPGNLAHAAQGGGADPDAIAHKVTALLADMPYLAIGWGTIALVGTLAIRPRQTVAFIRRHLPAFAAIAAAITVAAVTYTSPRQLTCPSFIVLYLILCAAVPVLCPGEDRAGEKGHSDRSFLRRERAVTIIATALAIVFLGTIAVLRIPAYMAWHSATDRLNADTRLTWPDAQTGIVADISDVKEKFTETNIYLARAIAPDPLLNCGIVTIGDPYTIHGLQRLGASSLTGILPAHPSLLKNTSPSLTNDSGPTLPTKNLGPLVITAGDTVSSPRPLQAFTLDSIRYTVRYH